MTRARLVPLPPSGVVDPRATRAACAPPARAAAPWGTLACVSLLALAGCGYTEQEWQAQLSKSERMQRENQDLRAQLAEAAKELEAARARAEAAARAEREAAPARLTTIPAATTPPPATPPPATTTAPPAAPAATAAASAPAGPAPVDRDDGLKVVKLRGRIKAGAKPEPVVDVQVKALGADAKLAVERIEGPCELALEGFQVRASATEPGTCKARIVGLNAAGTQRTAKEFSIEATGKKGGGK